MQPTASQLAALAIGISEDQVWHLVERGILTLTDNDWNLRPSNAPTNPGRANCGRANQT